MKLLALFATLGISAPYVPDISIYDSPTDNKKVVVEVCNVARYCHRLLTNKATLEQDYEKIQDWVNQVVDKQR